MMACGEDTFILLECNKNVRHHLANKCRKSKPTVSTW